MEIFHQLVHLLRFLGLICSCYFYSGLSITYTKLTLLFLGIILNLFSWRRPSYFERFLKEIKTKVVGESTVLEFIPYLCILLIYLHRSFLTWWDDDEITQYGYFAKLISTGWTWDNFFSLSEMGEQSTLNHCIPFFITLLRHHLA